VPFVRRWIEWLDQQLANRLHERPPVRALDGEAEQQVAQVGIATT
jgi:hypothetical protein